jgi:hypothetical protein
MMTWRVHMRRPRLLWHDMGASGFLAFNVLFLGSIAQAALFPVFLLLWAVSLGLPNAALTVLPQGSLAVIVALGFLSEAVRLSLAVTALRARPQRLSLGCAMLSHLVQPLASFATAKAFLEMLHMPFYWDKTQHGKARVG